MGRLLIGPPKVFSKPNKPQSLSVSSQGKHSFPDQPGGLLLWFINILLVRKEQNWTVFHTRSNKGSPACHYAFLGK